MQTAIAALIEATQGGVKTVCQLEDAITTAIVAEISEKDPAVVAARKRIQELTKAADVEAVRTTQSYHPIGRAIRVQAKQCDRQCRVAFLVER